MNTVLQYILYLVILVVLAIPLGDYMKKVMNGEKTFLSRVLTPCENAVYKILRIKKKEHDLEKVCSECAHFFRHRPCMFVFAPIAPRRSPWKSARPIRRQMGLVI